MTINTIICATKGSNGCKAAEDKAIELAKENNSKLIFLYVIDIKFMEKSGAAGDWAKDDVASGLKNIGSVILEMASEKAIVKGMSSENILTEERKGSVVSQIKSSVEEHNANLVVIGHPEKDVGFLEHHLLSKEGVESFVKRLKDEIGCEVMIV
jgi:nucleotide-binding universal stress UspA family protein